MTPEEKAIHLHYQMLQNTRHREMTIPEMNEMAKECALIAADEVLNYAKAHGFIGLTKYWEDIKIEIEKL